jgi:hypothetical protein
MKMSSVIVRPIASPAIMRNDPRGSTAVAKTTQTRKNVRMISIPSPWPALMPPPIAGVPRLTASCGRIGHEPLQQRRRDDRAEELRDPVGDGDSCLDPASDHESERDGRVEVAAGDVAHRRGP